MFQKLYRHLEEIRDGLRRDKTNTETAQVGEKVLEQLEKLNVKLHVIQRQSRLSVFGIFLVVIFSCIVFFITRSDQKRLNDRVNLRQTSIGVTGQSAEVYQAEKQMMLRHLDALDSLIIEQARSIRELKELNVTSVATFRRIRRHFYRIDAIPARSRPAISDSFTISQ